MPDSYNVYCDENCHLEHNDNGVMLLGALWTPLSDVPLHQSRIREIKEEFKARGELKWTKVSKSREDFFMEIVRYFFSSENLNLRVLIVSDKEKLDHSYHNKGSHDSFYYKMYFYLLRNILSQDRNFNIYIDIKDTRSQQSVIKLGEVLSNNFLDFERTMISRIQQIRSDESELLQLCDFLLGAISYKCRNLASNSVKLGVISAISELSGLSLEVSTPPWTEKINLFFFSPRG